MTSDILNLLWKIDAQKQFLFTSDSLPSALISQWYDYLPHQMLGVCCKFPTWNSWILILEIEPKPSSSPSPNTISNLNPNHNPERLGLCLDYPMQSDLVSEVTSHTHWSINGHGN